MGLIKKLAKSGVFGLTGLAASKKGMLNKIARNGGFGLTGMLAAKKDQDSMEPQVSRGPVRDKRMGPRMEPIRVTEMEEVEDTTAPAMRRGGKIKKMASGGSSASKRADGIAQKGKTRGKMC
jgi:hypothetical protein